MPIAAGAANYLLSDQIRLIRSLEQAGRLDRALEFLPSDEELAEWKALAPAAQEVILNDMGDAAKAKWEAIQTAKAACTTG